MTGLSPASAGCTLQVQNLSPSTIKIQPTGVKTTAGSGDAFKITLTDTMVAGGAVEVPFVINSLKTGSFSVVATLTDPADSQKKTCTCGCKGTPRPACAHSCGGDPCTG